MPNQYNLLRNTHIPSEDWSHNWAQAYRALLHQTCITYWEMRRPSPANRPQVYRTLLHHTSITYWEMRKPSPTNQAQVYRALLHQTNITYWEMRRPSPTNWHHVYRALLHQTSRPYWEIHTYPLKIDPPIKPKHTEPYYTKPVDLLRNKEALPCLSTPHVQSPTTPNQYILLRKGGVLPH